NANDNNKNREYPEIDNAIKRTYIEHSTAQKTKLYDMYARFFRWASNRLSENGILTFITNSSFLEARTFDGFRKVVAEEFNEIYVVDLGGNLRAGGKGNVFGVKVGVAISFMLKKQGANSCKIHYVQPKMDIASDKLDFLRSTKFQDIDFERIIPDKNYNWLNIPDNDFEDLLPLANKTTKLAKLPKEEHAVFKLFSLGVATNRDEWVYDYSVKDLKKKVTYLIDIYHIEVDKHHKATTSNISELLGSVIKWTRAVKNDLLKGKRYEFDNSLMIKSFYRPFVKKTLYFSKELNEMQSQLPKIFQSSEKDDNKVITTMGDSTGKPFFVLAINLLPDLNFVSPASGGTRCLPLYRYEHGEKIDNITDWGL
ncbi:MAG: hypothetical protein KAH77_03885, partial [Thiomargarita sp.]|nr:hypothetical protein [Thiomargarita sp.]